MPKWSDLFFGATVAVIAYTGIEAAANLAPEVRVKRPALRRTVSAGALAVDVVFVGMSVVALMALPVEPGVDVVGNQDSGFGTELGGRYAEAPVLGVVEALASGFAGDLLKYAVAIVATPVLSQAANAGMVGIARTTYTLATHRQLPRGVARLHPKYGTPWIVLVIFAALAFLLLLPADIELLAGMFAYGALIAFSLAHLSVCALRFKEPDRRASLQGPVQREGARSGAAAARCARRAPVHRRLGRHAHLPRRGAAASARSGCSWVSAIYVMYRSREGLSLTKRVEVPAERLTYEPEVTYGNILVPVFGEDLDDDIMSTAGQLASERTREGGAVIEAIYVLVVPMALPLDAPLPERKMAEARAALERAERVGEEYEGVDVITTLVRGRTVGLRDRRGGQAQDGRGDRDRRRAAVPDQGRQRAGRDRREAAPGARGGDGLRAREVALPGTGDGAAGPAPVAAQRGQGRRGPGDVEPGRARAPGAVCVRSSH